MQRDHAHRQPQQAVVQKHALAHLRRPGEEQRVLLRHRPIARQHVGQLQPDRVEDARPEVFQRPRGAKDRGGDQVHHEDRDALQVHDEDLARQRRHHEKQRAQKKDLDDHDEQKRLPVPPGVAAGDARVVRPRRQRPGRLADNHARERNNAGHERSCPAATEVRKLRNRLGEDQLQRVALEVAQHGRAEDCGNNDGSKQHEEDIENGRGVGPFRSCLPFPVEIKSSAAMVRKLSRNHSPK